MNIHWIDEFTQYHQIFHEEHSHNSAYPRTKKLLATVAYSVKDVYATPAIE